MKTSKSVRSVLIVVTTLGVSCSLTPATSASMAENYSQTSSPLGASDQERMSQEIAQGFETLFTEVVYEESPGNWAVNYDAAEREGVAKSEAETLASIMEAPLEDDAPSAENRSLKTFAECVVWNFAPVPLSPQDAAAIGTLLKNKQWKAAADKIVQVAALNGATAALDYGISAIGGPVVWVGKLALYAGSCALSEKLN